MQRIYNYGSSLQAYALRKLVEESTNDALVHYLDYTPGPPLVKSPDIKRNGGGRLRRTFEKVSEYSKTEARILDKIRFFNHKSHYASKYFPLIGISAAPRHEANIDLQIIGSDEVFNCVQDNTNVGYTRDLFGHESKAKKLISYAASFGNTTLEKIDAYKIRKELEEDFLKFDAISVRDFNSQEIVSQLIGERPEIHLDPTLVYPLSQDSKIPGTRQRSFKYIIAYGYSGRFNDVENQAVRKYANHIGAKVLAFGGLQSSADEFIDCDPFALLAYFRDAEAVITDTFHGTIFAIINEVPFATIIRKSHGVGYGNSEKLGYLLSSMNLECRALNDPSTLPELMEEAVDFSPVRVLREHQRARTLNYLRSAIDLGVVND
ncbi:Polysaccharide pyruvyl transferase [Pleomorphomonas diazotrophica]|nr:polysaccharide pyruvyl transferase family protein [Pleomorphomonas diazotrophica]SFN01384.1 Polysaccharide pyruvyl transferase [Pleomorphomonas diazotrophica]